MVSNVFAKKCDFENPLISFVEQILIDNSYDLFALAIQFKEGFKNINFS